MPRQTVRNHDLNNIINRDAKFAGFYLDEFLRKIYADSSVPELSYHAGEPIEDRHLTQMANYLSLTHDIEVPNQRILDQLTLIAHQRKRNPVKDKLESLTWDSAARLDNLLLSCAGVEAEGPALTYVQAITAKFLISAVARAYEPGCKVDTVLVLEGEQGVRKSTFVEELGAIAGKRYVLTTKIQLGNKDSLQNVASAWFVLIDEFAGFRRAELDDLKAFVSQRKDTFRAPYDRLQQEHVRRCVFMATINNTESDYLEDPTGNRRFWPVEVKKTLDLDYLRANLEQVWAEAVVRYKAGEQWYIDDQKDEALLEEVKRQQKSRQTRDPWEPTITEWVRKRKKEREPRFYQEHLLSEALKIEPKDQNQGHRIRVGKILTRLGMKGVRDHTDDGLRPRVYDATQFERSHLEIVPAPIPPKEQIATSPVEPERERF